MSYRFRARESVSKGVRRIAREEIDRAMGGLLDPASERNAAVHDARKRLKKVRALLRLVREELGSDAFRGENRCYRDVARALSGIRDSWVRVQTAERLAKANGHTLDPIVLDGLRTLLLHEHRTRLAETESNGDRTSAALENLRTAWSRIPKWPLKGDRWRTLAIGLDRTYRTGRKEFRASYVAPEPEKFHEWRKRVKDLWYSARLLEAVWPAVMRPFADQLHDLSELLGNLHDLHELRAHLLERKDGAGLEEYLPEVLQLIDREADRLAESARPIAERVYAEAPDAFLKRMRSYWKTWKWTGP